MSKADVCGRGEMRTSAAFWGFSTKFDINLDKKLLKFDVHDITNNTAIKSHCNTENI